MATEQDAKNAESAQARPAGIPIRIITPEDKLRIQRIADANGITLEEAARIADTSDRYRAALMTKGPPLDREWGPRSGKPPPATVHDPHSVRSLESIRQDRDAALAKYRKDNQCSFTHAWDAVRRAHPELFPGENADEHAEKQRQKRIS